jgi:hypothetical protein
MLVQIGATKETLSGSPVFQAAVLVAIECPAPALGERRHRSFARRMIAVRWRPTFMVREDERPHPRRSHGCRVGFENAADDFPVRDHVVVIIVPFAGWPTERRALQQ